jgi:hypothetical protein
MGPLEEFAISGVAYAAMVNGGLRNGAHRKRRDRGPRVTLPAAPHALRAFATKARLLSALCRLKKKALLRVAFPFRPRPLPPQGCCQHCQPIRAPHGMSHRPAIS